MDERDYEFVVLGEDDTFLKAAILPHDDRAKRYYVGIWHKMQQACAKYHDLAASGIPGWVSWKPHEWCDQVRGCEDRQKYVAWCGSMMVGFLNLRPGYPSAEQPGAKVMYVEHMAAAPGNIPTPVWGRRVSHVGLMLLAYAALQSKLQGFGGLVGLHAADADAAAYYRRVRVGEPGSSPFRPERTGVQGIPGHGADLTKPYFETATTGSDALLEDYRRD